RGPSPRQRRLSKSRRRPANAGDQGLGMTGECIGNGTPPAPGARSRAAVARARPAGRSLRPPPALGRGLTRWHHPPMSVAPVVVHSRLYECDIGPHVFPVRKYSLVLARLVAEGAIRESEVLE